MASKSKIPTAAEVKKYLDEQMRYMRECIENHRNYVIGKKTPVENVMWTKITLPLMEAAESVGCEKEEIWELCKQITKCTHAPVTVKEYERMIPFAEKPATVDAVLKLLETYSPPFDVKYRTGFDITGYYYCIALISLADHRQDDCEKRLWDTVDMFIEKDTDSAPVLLRNMNQLGGRRPFLIPMRDKLKAAIDKAEAKEN